MIDGFVMGVMSAVITYAIFRSRDDEAYDEDDLIEEVAAADDDYDVSDYKERSVTMSCQTCRKLKRHREIEPNLYQCVKCKRHTDLRRR
ncbi:hypothetical protein HHO41_04880 [Bacillus sp. DNRA2]|uniref:hypothetical protein n=1 Tax=Bacillus sp. DNRA2 TaxID=2723053 RepID=UPI00145C9CC8|nr:hypothetical protein [Bacillus sp. DNRA2]NMD69615.1 hypothetical protein [Bacillus sp. DNRA2]